MHKGYKIACMLAAFVLLTSAAAIADPTWVSMGGSSGPSQPTYEVLSSNEFETVIQFTTYGFWTETVSEEGITFQTLELPGYFSNMDIGKPQVPAIIELIQVPNDATVSVSITGYTEEGLPGYHVYPFQELLAEDETTDGLEYDEAFYAVDQVYPAVTTEVGDPAIYRDIRVVKLTVYPIRQNAATGELTMYPDITVRLEYTPGGKSNVLSPTTRAATPTYDKLYRQSVINYENHPLQVEGEDSYEKLTAYDFLIIAKDAYVDNMAPLVSWKNSQGLSTQIVSMTTVGSTVADVKDYISQEYTDNGIQYVLLIGNEYDIPFYTGYLYGGSAIYSDYYYTLLSGSDNLPEIAVGRFCVHSEADVDNMVGKTVMYEHNPPAGDWHDKALLIANAQDAPYKYQGCKEEIRTATYNFMTPDFTTAYGALSSVGGDEATNADVTAAINSGYRVVNYRGHGSTTSWSYWNYLSESYTNTNVAGLSNGDLTPVIFSIACVNNQVQISTNCFGEAWTLSTDGAVAFLGANRPSATTANHTYDKRIFKAVYDENVNRTGDVSNLGAITIINQFGTSGLNNARMYFWMGDPSLNILYTGPVEPPESWTATYGTTGDEEAIYGTPVNDTSWSSGYHTLTAYLNSPKSATMTVAQSVSYSLYIPGGLCDTYEYVEIKKNGTTIREAVCSSSDQSQTGSFTVLPGDVIAAYVWGFIKDGDPDKKPPGSAQFTYYTTEPTGADLVGYAFAGSTSPLTEQVLEYVEGRIGGSETDTMTIAQTISYELYVPPGMCFTYELSEIRVNGTRVAVLYCDEPNDTETGSFSVQVGDIVLARVMGGFKDGDPGKLPPASAKYSYYTYGPADADYYLVKTDPFAEEEWTAAYGTSYNDAAQSALMTSDGGYIIAGYSQPPGFSRFYVVKFDANGAYQWDNSYFHGTYDKAMSIAEAGDGGYLVFGTTNLNGDDDFMAVKINSSGVEQWYYTYGVSGVDDWAAEVKRTADDGFILVGSTGPNPDSWDAYLVKITSDGTLSWSQALGSTSYAEYGYGVEQAADGYIVVGKSYESGNGDALLLKTNTSGAEQWSSLFGDTGFEQANDVMIDVDGNYALTGITTSFGEGGQDLYIVKADAYGNLIWSTSFGGSDGDNAECIMPTPDGGYLLTGATSSFGAGLNDFYAVKFLAPPPAAPSLVSPSNGASYTTSTSVRVTLNWTDISDAMLYEVVVDDNSDFSSPLYDIDDLIFSTWLTPYLGVDYYYWRARAWNETGWGAWSDSRYFRVKRPVVVTSCPVLYSYNGEEFRKENPLLTACEKSGYVDIVTDYYHLQSEMAVKNGELMFQLRELEDEITYLQDVELITVDHSKNVNIACAVDGSIATFSHKLPPLSAVDDKGINRLAAVSKEDGTYFTASEPGFLVVTFPNTGDNTGVCMEAQQKLPCEIEQEENDIFNKPAPVAEVEFGDLIIEVLGNDGQWLDISSLMPPRENPKEEVVLTNIASEIDSDVITMRLSWSHGYSTDNIAQFVLSDEVPTIKSWTIGGHELKLNKPSDQLWNGFIENQPLVLAKGDVFEFGFQPEPLTDENMMRDYIIKAVGRYQPDYSVFSRLLPKKFELYNNYPNPFNPTTTISYDLPVATHVSVEIYNVLGQVVTCLIDENQSAGHYQVIWDSKDGNGDAVASGMYFYRIKTDQFVNSKKMILLK